MSQPAFAENCPDPTTDELDALARDALRLGYEVVEISGTLDEIDEDARSQAASMAKLKTGAKAIVEANAGVEETALGVKARAEGSRAFRACLNPKRGFFDPRVGLNNGFGTGLEFRHRRGLRPGVFVYFVKRPRDFDNFIAKAQGITRQSVKFIGRRIGTVFGKGRLGHRRSFVGQAPSTRRPLRAN